MYAENQYYELSKFAKTFDYGNILSELKDEFGYIHSEEEIDDIGLKLQVTVKRSKPMYLHGYVLSSALHHYLTRNNYKNITILETGTARGFSSVVMATVMEMNNVNGKIHTIDYVNTFDNCLKSAQMKRKVTIDECVEEWKSLVNKYIIFEKGDSKQKIIELQSSLSRIHFAFLDGAHYYNDLKYELEFVESKQNVGDVIVCDDYTKSQYPEICQAIDEFVGKGKYEYKIFYGNDGTKSRGYVYMIKKK